MIGLGYKISDPHLVSKAHLIVDDFNEPYLTEHEAHHLFVVKRLIEGDSVTLCDGRGTVVPFRVVCNPSDRTTRRNKRDKVLVLQTDGDRYYRDFSAPILEMVLSVIDPDRLDIAISKLTELGVARITLVEAHRSRSVPQRLGEGRLGLARLTKITREAAGQSRSLYLPELSFGDYDAVMDRVIVCDMDGEDLVLPPSSVLIGPEGGFAPGEIPSTVTKWRLPGNVLRAETAALVAASLAIGMFQN